MAVRQGDPRQPADRPAAGIGRGVGIDEIGGDIGEPARGGNRPGVARIPAVFVGAVGLQQRAARLVHAHQAGDGDGALRLPGGAAFRIAFLARHEAAIDEDRGAVGLRQRRDHPGAGTEFGRGIDQRFPGIVENAFEAQAAVFVVAGVDACPLRLCRRGCGLGMDAGVDAGDQVAFPEETLHLPGAERGQRKDGEDGERGEDQAGPAGTGRCGARFGHRSRFRLDGKGRASSVRPGIRACCASCPGSSASCWH